MFEAASTERDPSSPYDGIWGNRVRLRGSARTVVVPALDFRNAFGLPSHGFVIRESPWYSVGGPYGSDPTAVSDAGRRVPVRRRSRSSAVVAPADRRTVVWGHRDGRAPHVSRRAGGAGPATLRRRGLRRRHRRGDVVQQPDLRVAPARGRRHLGAGSGAARHQDVRVRRGVGPGALLPGAQWRRAIGVAGTGGPDRLRSCGHRRRRDPARRRGRPRRRARGRDSWRERRGRIGRRWAGS